ncbi:MAG: peptidase T, partial [Hominenteromicrobium sp.]
MIYMSVKDRFLDYVRYDTQSDETSGTMPSTAKQKILAQRLVEDMLAIGIADAHMDEHGYVYGTIPANCAKKN